MSLLKLSVFSLVFLGSVVALPMINDNSVEDSDVIDLSGLGERAYGTPSNASGDRLNSWDPETSKDNPEETGEYEQGDILFPPSLSRNGLRSETTRWPSGVVPYTIEGSYSSQVRENIMKAIADYHRLTCIRFTPRSNQQDYIAIVSKNTGCWSSVGRIGGRQEVNLQNPGCVNMKGTILHELMHALGFLHEQSRSERDKYVRINFQNVKSKEAHNFDKADEKTINAFNVPYSYDSVMHYSENAFSANGQPTIEPLVSNVKIGQRLGLSRSDVEKINAMYKCPSKSAPENGWNSDNVYVGTSG